MARHPRFVIPGHPQHVVVRGNNRQEIFCAEADYRFYLEKLKAACDKHQCDIHAYVLMTNHVHLLITPHREDGISKAMQMVGRYKAWVLGGYHFKQRMQKQLNRRVEPGRRGGDRKSQRYLDAIIKGV